jgi:AraC-like DNA-binding protein/quercetin dioxygenase-like cupin family protein
VTKAEAVAEQDEHEEHAAGATLVAHPKLAGVTMFSAPPGLHEHAIHAHEAFSVISVVSGTKKFHCAGQDCEVRTGEFAIANPGQLHGCGPWEGQPWSHRTWYLSQQLVDELAASMGWLGPAQLKTPKIIDAVLWQCLNTLHEVSQTDDALEWQSATLEALGNFVDRHGSRVDPHAYQSPDTQSHERFSACAEMMVANLSTHIDLAQLARVGGVSQSQVIRDFKAAVATTPAVYLRQIRLARARGLISSGASLLDAALASGFSDQSHFSRCFKGVYGVTPGQFGALSKSVKGDTAL